jgi:hypothetical protein
VQPRRTLVKYASVAPRSRLEIRTVKRETASFFFLQEIYLKKRGKIINMKKQVILPLFLVLTSLSFFVFPQGSRAAIEYGGNTYQAPFAASTTSKVGEIIDHVVKDELGASSTTDVAGITKGAKNIFTRISDWLREKAGIDLSGIFKGILNFFVTIFKFLFGLIKDSI